MYVMSSGMEFLSKQSRQKGIFLLFLTCIHTSKHLFVSLSRYENTTINCVYSTDSSCSYPSDRSVRFENRLIFLSLSIDREISVNDEVLI